MHFHQVAGKSFPVCASVSLVSHDISFSLLLPCFKLSCAALGKCGCCGGFGGPDPDLTVHLRCGCCSCRLGKQPAGTKGRQFLHHGMAHGHLEDLLPSCGGAKALGHQASMGKPPPRGKLVRRERWDQRVPVPTEQHLAGRNGPRG